MRKDYVDVAAVVFRESLTVLQWFLVSYDLRVKLWSLVKFQLQCNWSWIELYIVSEFILYNLYNSIVQRLGFVKNYWLPTIFHTHSNQQLACVFCHSLRMLLQMSSVLMVDLNSDDKLWLLRSCSCSSSWFWFNCSLLLYLIPNFMWNTSFYSCS